jgi:hypothetical protein
VPDDTTMERLAHALTPWEWRGRTLALLIVVFAVVAAVTVVQRALVAEGAVGWTFVGVHTAVATLAVGGLSIRAVRRWRRLRSAGLGPGQTSAAEPS